MAGAQEFTVVGRTVRVSNPDKVYFPERGITKGDVAPEDFDITTVPARFAQVGAAVPGAARLTTRFRLDGAWIALPSG